MPVSLIIDHFKQRNQIADIVLDATVREVHHCVSHVTTNPVEDGSNISDHIVHEPMRITLEDFVTDTPVMVLGGLGRDPQFFDDRPQEIFDTLLELQSSKTLVTVLTGLKQYQEMAISELQVPRDQYTGKALRFTITLTQVNKVSLKTVSLPPDELPTHPEVPHQVVDSVELGNVPTQQLDTPLPSLLTQWVDGLSGYWKRLRGQEIVA